jgi:lysozyme family protein
LQRPIGIQVQGNVIGGSKEMAGTTQEELHVRGEQLMATQTTFDKAFQKVIEAEGGWSNVPQDSGGATMWGITHQVLARYRKKPFVTNDEIRSLTIEEAKQIYKAFYWDPMNLEGLDEKVCLVLFDQGVNFGIGAAMRRAQTILNRFFGARLTVDGQAGPMTKGALQKLKDKNDVERFIKEYICESQDNYVRIVINNNSQLVFLAGWINRTQKLMDYLVG